MVRYLKDGEDFGPQHFRETGLPFTGSAAGAPAGDRSSDENRFAAAQQPKTGTKFKPRDPWLMNHDDHAETPAKLADGGKAIAEGAPIKVNPMTRNADPNMRTSPGPETTEVSARKGGRIKRADGGSVDDDSSYPERYQQAEKDGDYLPPAHFDNRTVYPRIDGSHYHNPDQDMPKAKGGRIKRAIGGVIPGQAPVPEAQPMTRTPIQAPNSPGGPGTDGGLMKNATVSMPAGDMAQLASGAVKAGARAALGAVAARSRRPGPALPGAAATAPMAGAPAPAATRIPGAMPAGMKGGGRVKRAMGGPMGGMPGNPMNGGMIGSAMGAAPMGAGVARPMPAGPGGAPGAMPASVPMMAKGGRMVRGNR